MDLDENEALPSEPEIPAGLEIVAVFSDVESAHEAGLVALAMGQAYWMFPSENGYALCAKASVAGRVERELIEWRRLRSDGRSDVSALWPERSIRMRSFVLAGLLLAGVFVAQQEYPLVAVGSSDAKAIFDSGQWWRVVTALTLHGDVVHLISNLVAGLGFVALVVRVFGVSVGWCMVFLSGSLGNFVTAWLHYPQEHMSIGASTSVFGALGILTGASVWLALFDMRRSVSLPQWLLPILGGLTLLGLLGMGDGPIDILAHVCGFGFGLVMGLAGACLKLPERRAAFLNGWCLSGFVLLVLGLSWSCALFWGA